MNKLINFFKEKSVLYLFIPFLILGFVFQLFYGKYQSHLIINGYHNDFGDFFFKYITYLGDGIIFAIIIVITFFLKFKWSLYFFTASLLTLFFMFITKQLLFHGIPRPIAFFENLENLYLINGVKVYTSNSFPSGHTTTAFAVFSLLILITKNNYLKLTFASLAILAGFSRIYLSQHFLIDVLIGAISGVIIALISCWIIDRICSKNKIIADESISVEFLNKEYDNK